MRIADLVVRRAVWVVVAWVAAVTVLNLAVPQLEAVVADDSTPVVPESAPSVETLAEMDEEFGNGRSTSVLFVVVERDGGLSRSDRDYVRDLVPQLRRDEHVSFVQDVVRRPELLRALTSHDGEAAYLQVGVPGATGAPASLSQVEAVRGITERDQPQGLDVAVTGPTATIADVSTEIEHSFIRITLITVGLIAVIVLLLYRSLAVTALILGFIGIALAAARGATAWSGLHVFDVSTFTGSFLTAVVLGAATDYAVFLTSRYQEERRSGHEYGAAIRTASRRTGAVIAGSALTVVLGASAMGLAALGLFSTTGPAIAVGVGVTLLLSLTFLPALVTLFGARGWLDPRPRRRERDRWRRVASLVVSRPGAVLVAALIPLLLLASFYPAMDPSYDQRRVQPASTESNRGYELLSRHYPINEVLPHYVLVRSDRDLRNSRDLAALEQAATSVARTPGVTQVRSLTRPTGRPISQASLGHQVQEVGRRLHGAEGRLSTGQAGADRLAAGAGQLDTGATRVAAGADRAVAGSGRLLEGLRSLESGVRRLAGGSDATLAGSRRLRTGASALADGLRTAYDQTQLAVDGLGMAYDGLQRSPTCGLEPICQRSREGVGRVYTGLRDRLLPGLRRAASGAEGLSDGSLRLSEGLARVETGLDRAERGANRLAQGQRKLRAGLGELASGTDRVAEGTGQVAAGTERASASVGELRTGLGRAATYLRQAGSVARDPAVGGFYLPPAALDDPRFATASGIFLSEDGRTARMFVLGDSDSFDDASTERAERVQSAAENGLRGTRLRGSDVTTSGISSINGDIEQLSTRDFRMVALLALLAVFLVLLVVLRSLLAATFLLGSVILSYGSAMGLAVLVWQVGLDRPLDWTVPTIAFVLLVAVGADYNLLLMKRMRDEAPDGDRVGIATAVASTGRVITAAGLIFAASMFAMTTSPVTTLAQVGSTIGAGLLIDTFLVRTLVVPSFAALAGSRLWPAKARRAVSRDGSAEVGRVPAHR